MQNCESGYHLQGKIFKTACIVSPLQRGFKLAKVCLMKMFFFLLKKVLIYVHNSDTNAWWDFITDARFVLPKLFFFFLLQELFFPDLSGQNKTPSMLSQPASHWQACGWQLCFKLPSSFSSSKLSDMMGIYHPLHSQWGLRAIRRLLEMAVDSWATVQLLLIAQSYEKCTFSRWQIFSQVWY